MSDLGEQNKTIITVGIALISLSLGAILINRHSGNGNVSDSVPMLEGVQTANIAESGGNKNLKPKSPSVNPKTTKDTNLTDSIMVSPVVSQHPNLAKTPSPTPQTPTATPSKPDPDFVLNGVIPPNGYFLLERSDSSTTNLTENQVYTGALNNTCEVIELRDSGGGLKDRVDCGDNVWFAGQGGGTLEEFSMERRGAELLGSDPNSWATNDGITRNGSDASGNPINGTPGFKNSQEI